MRARISGCQRWGTNARQSNKTGPDDRLDSLRGRFGDLSGPSSPRKLAVNAVSQQGMPVGNLGSLRLARHTAGWSWSSLHGLVLRFRGDLSGQSA